MARRVFTPADIEWWRVRCEHLEANLAAVEALCESDPYNGFIPCMDVLAAARGEVDQPADICAYANTYGRCLLPSGHTGHHSARGEGDRG